MKNRREFIELAAAAAAAATAMAPAAHAAEPVLDQVLRAMKDEMERSRMLRLAGLDVPYFFEYSLDDVELVAVQASLGGLIQSRRTRLRAPRVEVRVGDYKFDNTNYVFSGFYRGTRLDGEQWPIDDSYEAIRRQLWLATDRAYKTAVEAIARKRAALKNASQPDSLPDFTQSAPVRMVLPYARIPMDEERWAARARDISAVFAEFPSVVASTVDFDAMQTLSYLANSEGALVRTPDQLAYWRIRASGFAADGMQVRDATVLHTASLTRVPADAQVERAARDVAQNVAALVAAPAGESYAGPVLFEGVAAAQLFAELLAPNLALSRKPVAEPGRQVPWMAGELDDRMGSRILPEFMDVVDDPAQREWRGRMLLGYTPVDMEGVVPEPLTVVEKGRLKAFLLTRTPVGTGFAASNGRARLPGPFGAKAAVAANLFVTARETVTPAALRKQLLDLCAQRNKKYGFIVRKMDYPSSATFGEVRSIAAAQMQGGGGTRPVSIPLLIFRVNVADGKEELVRGLRFRALSVRSLKDILSASDQPAVFDYLYNQAPFSVMGAGGYVAPTTVVAPAVLFEDLELAPLGEELQKPPIVPPPPLQNTRTG